MRLDRGLDRAAGKAAACSPTRARPGSFHSKLRPSLAACSLRTAVSHSCGNRPRPDFAYDLRRSYEPPVSGPIHYRCSPAVGERSIYQITFSLAEIAFLSLFGLSTAVIFVLLALVVVGLFARRLGRRGGALELLHTRFDFVHEANIFVVFHHPARGFIIGAADRARSQVDMADVAHLYPGEAQRHRKGEEGHAERHREPRLASHGDDR